MRCLHGLHLKAWGRSSSPTPLSPVDPTQGDAAACWLRDPTAALSCNDWLCYGAVANVCCCNYFGFGISNVIFVLSTNTIGSILVFEIVTWLKLSDLYCLLLFTVVTCWLWAMENSPEEEAFFNKVFFLNKSFKTIFTQPYSFVSKHYVYKKVFT